MFLVSTETSRRGYCNNRPHGEKTNTKKKGTKLAHAHTRRTSFPGVQAKIPAVEVDTWTTDHPLTTRYSRVTEEEGVPRRNWFITCRMFFEAAAQV